MLKRVLSKLLIAIYVILPLQGFSFQITEDNDWIYLCCPSVPNSGTYPNYKYKIYDSKYTHITFSCKPKNGSSNCDYSGWHGSGSNAEVKIIDHRMHCGYLDANYNIDFHYITFAPYNEPTVMNNEERRKYCRVANNQVMHGIKGNGYHYQDKK